jgi:hypothetical protein
VKAFLKTGRLAVAALLLAALIIPAQAGARAPRAPRTSPDFFGVNGAMLRNFVSPDRAGALEGLAASMGQQGISWMRLTFDQAVEERQKGNFNWYTPDTMIAALARHGVSGAAVFVGTAGWAADPAQGGKCSWRAAPFDLAGWTDWVAAAARRYGSNGTFWAAHPELPKLPIQRWEIGNEVNSSQFWCPAANPEQYAKVYSASANSIRTVDPAAKVIVAGLAPRFGQPNSADLDVPSFLARMTAADPSLRSTIPEVGIHPYAGSVQAAIERVAQFRQAMIGAGMPRTPMLVNEIGWYTSGNGIPHWRASEDQRAAMIAGVTNRFWRLDCGVSGIAPYSWVTLEQNTADADQWFGLADARTGAPHQSGLAYGEQIRLALTRGGLAASKKRARSAKSARRARRARRPRVVKCMPRKRRPARAKRRARH